MEYTIINDPAEEYIPRYTYEDYCRWEGRWELINGIAYAMTPSPVFKHQDASGNIHIELYRLLKKCSNCVPVQAVDWRINDMTVVCPDNMVVCNKDHGDFVTGPPAIIFEILSPSTGIKDKKVKFRLYESQGVPCYIIVDIENRMAEIFELSDGMYGTARIAGLDSIPLPVCGCNIGFDFSIIWPAQESLL